MIHHIKRVVSEFLSGLFIARYGTVASFNPADYTVKVILQPEGTMTGFIPLTAPWVGPNFGAVFGPQEGDQVLVHFIDGNLQAALAGGRTFNNAALPPLVQPGQAAIVDGQGSYVRLNNDGTVTVKAATTATLSAQSVVIDANVTVNGTLSASGTISSSSDVLANGTSGHSHTHGGVQPGSANTLPPN